MKIVIRKEAPKAPRVLGDWADVARTKAYGAKGKKYSDFDIMLRQEFQAAWNGDLPAIKTMMQMLDANLKARDYHHPASRGVIQRGDRPVRRPEDEPRNADMALLILGICAIDNRALKPLRDCDEPSDEKLRSLRPNCVESWVLQLCPDVDASEYKNVVESGVSIEVSDWYVNNFEILEDLKRAHRPGATRFQPGKSGNVKGRPRKKPPLYPHEEFFMETVEARVHGKKRVLTRLDALMSKLTSEASKGDAKLRRLIAPILIKLEQRDWEKNNIAPKPRVIRA